MLNSIILSLLVAWSAQAEKTPLSLEQLCQSSDLIAVVQADLNHYPETACAEEIGYTDAVGRADSADDMPAAPEVQRASVLALTTLKGEVPVESFEICAPPVSTRVRGLEFESDQAQLVFLQRTKDGRFACYSHADRNWIHGARLAAYQTAVESYLQVQAMAEPAQRSARLHAWRMELAINPLTRADGVRSLRQDGIAAAPTSAAAGTAAAAGTSATAAAGTTAVQLSAADQDRLITALVRTADFGKTNQQLFQLLDSSNDPRLTDFAMAVVRSWNDEIPWRGRYWLHQIATRLGGPAALEYFHAHWTEFDSYFGGKDWSFDGTDGTELEIMQKLLSQLAPAA